MTLPLLSPSPLDSTRFGLKILRGRAENLEAKTLAAEIIATACDVCILRVPAGQSAGITPLTRWALPVIHADTLVYYKCDLSRYEPLPLRNSDLAFSVATEQDMPELRLLIADTFREYVSHYYANPLFSREHILAGYQQWAENHVAGDGRTLWIARRGERIVAFAACQDHADSGDAEGILYGVAPEAAGGGLYGDLIRHTQAVAKARGAATMKVSTQVTNFAVQKVWAREGFHLFEAFDTFHINALFSTGDLIVDRELVFTAEQIERFAEVSGDANPLHVDTDAARAAGFQDRIAHGVMAAMELSRILGTDTPGPGTVISHMDLAFLRPLVAGVAYNLTVRIPGGLKDKGPMVVVSRILDGEGRTCVIARSDIVLRR